MACTITDAHSLPSMIVINISALNINNDTTYYGVLNKETRHEYLRHHSRVVLLAHSSMNANKSHYYFHI